MTLRGTLIAVLPRGARSPKWKRALAAAAAIIILMVGFAYLFLVQKNPSAIQVVLVAVLCAAFATGAFLYAAFA